MEERVEAPEMAEEASEREAFFDWLDDVAAANATQNSDLTEDEVLAIIEEARCEATAKSSKDRIRR